MEKDSGDRNKLSKPIGTVREEWTLDLDNVVIEMDEPGEGKIRVKGRCKRCWGGLTAKGNDDPLPETILSICCRVCGKKLEGDKAREEFQRMLKEQAHIVSSLSFGLGLAPKRRGKADFVQKFFPPMDRLSIDEFCQRVKAQSVKGEKEGWLTRSNFPVGSAGFLFLQARTLMSGLEQLSIEMSVVRFPKFKTNEDGSLAVYRREDLDILTETAESELMQRLGSTMTAAMMAAFSCELAMKAIRLIQLDEARKSHDLWQLYCDLPSDSRERIKADFTEIEPILKSARHTFDKWRYFEANVGGRGLSAMIDTERAFGLAKAARVILDEAMMVGLGYYVGLDVTRTVSESDDKRYIHFKHNLTVEGREAPTK